MPKLKFISTVCLVSFATLCLGAPKYQVATIMAVKPHQPANEASGAVSYDVTVKVDKTSYVVLYTPPLGTNTVKYATGREILVLVGKNNHDLQRPIGAIDRVADPQAGAD